MQVTTLVVVPTIDLMHQWHDGIKEKFGLDEAQVGMVGGGFKNARPITVITYDSAAMPRRDLSAYGLLIFDEAHHLPSASYRTIATRADAPFRLGLSATLERSDGRHDDLRAAGRPDGLRAAAADVGPRQAYRRLQSRARLRGPDRRRAGALRPA